MTAGMDENLATRDGVSVIEPKASNFTDSAMMAGIKYVVNVFETVNTQLA
jgi:acyl CoA:acetate/3-ketoacid CoA transferase alpha subunit